MTYAPPPPSRPSSCASCARRPPVKRSPAYPGGPLVWMCVECADDAPRAARVVERGYVVPDRDYAATIRAIARAPEAGLRTPRYTGRAATPGFILERVFKFQQGRTLSRQDALDTLRDNSWFADLRYVGSDRRFHLFERPDEATSTKVRRASNYNAATALADAAQKKTR